MHIWQKILFGTKSIIIYSLIIFVGACNNNFSTNRVKIIRENYEISFTCPSNFESGRLSTEDDVLNKAIVLVEKGFNSEHELRQISLGASSCIMLYTEDVDDNSQLADGALGKLDTRVIIGNSKTYIYDDYPGPCGDSLFHFVVPINHRINLNIVGNKVRYSSFSELNKKDNKPSKYDQVIRQIIRSLEITPAQ